MNHSESANAAAVRHQLVDLVHRHGPELLDDSRRVRAMLADAVAGATAEANLVGLALSSGVPAKLRDAAADPSRAGSAVADTAAELERTSSVQSSDSQWAVAAIAEALGLSQAPATAGAAIGTAHATAERPGAASAAPQRPGPSLAGPNDLVVRVAGQEHLVHGGSVLTFGRDPGSTVMLESTAVSRQHGRVQQGRSGWEYVDLDSTQGSFVDGARVRTHPLRSETVVVLGQGTDAVQVRLSPFGQANTALPQGAAAAGRAAATEVPQRPGGALGSAPAARTELGGAGGPVLTVTLGSATRTVAPGGSLSVGRETDNDLVATATTVSRHHVTVEGTAGAWRLRDLGSTSGTWLDGRRITEVGLSGRQEFVLGDLDKGDRLVTEAPAGATGGIAGSTGATGGHDTGKGRGRWSVPVLAAVAVVVVLALVAAGTFLVRALNDDADTPAAGKLTTDQMAQGTVLLGVGDGWGSGTVIDKELGLILTNAHVAAPAAVGTAVSRGIELFDPSVKNPTTIVIAVASGVGKPAEPRFTGEVVAADGYLDLAVVKITKTTAGGFVEDAELADLVEVPIGDSDAVEVTDELAVIGYPGSQNSLGPTYSKNVVSGYSPDERVGTNRGWINSTDVVAHGNSGGLAANDDGQLVGVPTLLRADNLSAGLFPDYTTVGSAMRPVNLAKDLIAAAREGKEYESKYAVAAPANAKVLGLHEGEYVAPADPGSITGGCDVLSEGPEDGDPVALGIDYENFPGGDHTDVLAIVQEPGVEPGADEPHAASITTWQTPLPKKGCMTFTTDLAKLPARFELVIALGGDMKVIWRQTFTVE